MKYRNLIPAALIALTLITTATANAKNFKGGISDGGGKSVVCRNAQGEITKAETLDLYEGRAFWGLEIPESPLPYDKQLNLAVRKLEKSRYSEEVGQSVIMVRNNLRFLPDGDRLADIDDSLQAIIPRCPIEQLANFFNAGNIVINGEIWNKLSETSKASLILHEALYYLDRRTGVKDSRRARRITAELMSNRNLFVEDPYDVPDRSTYCYTGIEGLREAQTSFYLYNYDQNTYLNFLMLEGERKLTKTFVETPLPFDNLFRFSLTTQGSFESGDTIRIWEETTVSNGVSTTKMYLDGLSGWLPGKQFPKRELRCLTLENPEREDRDQLRPQ